MDKKVFIVTADDDKDDQELIEEALQGIHPDHTLNMVGNGLELLNLLQDLSARNLKFPDLIFLDLNMPIVSGRDAIKIIKAEQSPFSAIPVVILTTSGAAGDKKHCLDCGAEHYIVKPNSFSELKKVLNDAILRFSGKQ